MFDYLEGQEKPNKVQLNWLNQRPFSDRYFELARTNWMVQPMYKNEEEMRRLVGALRDKNVDVIIVKAGTGTGKTVLVPKIVLKNEVEQRGLNDIWRIGMTLPKTTPTERAGAFGAETLDVKLGEEVGYVYKGSDEKSFDRNRSRLVYMTDGYLLKSALSDTHFKKYTAVIIDEAHERSKNIDMLFYKLKRALEIRRGDFKVIIISATIDPRLFINYFCDSPGIRSLALNSRLNFEKSGKSLNSGTPQSSKVMKWCAENRTRTVVFSPETSYSIKEVYVSLSNTSSDSLLNGATPVNEKKKSDKEKEELLIKALNMALQSGELPRGKVALVFVSTSNEAKKGCETIDKACKEGRLDPQCTAMSFVPLFSKLTKEDQDLATGVTVGDDGTDVLLAGPYERKIVFSTNIAESSLTVKNLNVVIDFGNEFENRWSPLHNAAIMEEVKATRAQIEQRRGRVGRTAPGTVYYLYSPHDRKTRPEYPAPAICKADITEDVLQSMQEGQNVREIRKMFQDYLTPPSRDQIISAFYALFVQGLIYSKYSYVHSDQSDDLSTDFLHETLLHPTKRHKRNKSKKKSPKRIPLTYNTLRDIMINHADDPYKTMDATISYLGTFTLKVISILRIEMTSALIIVAGVMMFYPDAKIVNDVFLLVCLLDRLSKVQMEPFVLFFDEPRPSSFAPKNKGKTIKDEKNEKFFDFRDRILKRVHYKPYKEHESILELFHYLMHLRKIERTPFINVRFLDEVVEAKNELYEQFATSYLMRGNSMLRSQEKLFSHKDNILTQIHERIPSSMLGPIEKCVLYARLMHVSHVRWIPAKNNHELFNKVTLKPVKIQYLNKRGNFKENMGVYESASIKSKGKDDQPALAQGKMLTVFSQKVLNYLDFMRV